MTTQTCEFVPVSEVLPQTWRPWFMGAVLDSSPFSWGGNNRSLVTADLFADWVEQHYDIVVGDHEVPACAFASFMRKLRRMLQTYIDLEN